MLIRSPRGWEMPQRLATPEAVYWNRRRFLQALGLTSLGVLGVGCDSPAESRTADELGALRGLPEPSPTTDLYPAPRAERYTLDRPLTRERVAATYNNFYEFSPRKEHVARLVSNFRTRPWQIEVAGLVKKPQTLDIDELVRRMPLEERLYRHRCVEAWSMAVPWTGFSDLGVHRSGRTPVLGEIHAHADPSTTPTRHRGCGTRATPGRILRA